MKFSAIPHSFRIQDIDSNFHNMKLFWLMVLLSASTVGDAQMSGRKAFGRRFSYAGKFHLNGQNCDIRSFEGKKIIIDLFSSGCIVCFKMLPRMDSLNKLFSSRLQILLLGKYDNIIESVHSKFTQKYQLSLPVSYDSVYFRRHNLEFFPTYLWLNEDLTIEQVTGPEQVTLENINAFLNRLPRTESAGEIEFAGPKINGPGTESGVELILSSSLTGWTSQSRFSIPDRLTYLGGTAYFEATGVTAEDLYKYAYIGGLGIPADDSMYQYQWPRLDLHELSVTTRDSLSHSTRFSYIFKGLNTSSVAPLENALRNDLQSLYGLRGEKGLAWKECWAIVLNDSCFSHSLRSKGAQPKTFVTYGSVEIVNKPVRSLIAVLQDFFPGEGPYFDETGISYPIDLSVSAVMTDFDDFKAQIAQVGFVLVKRRKLMTVVTLKK